MEDAVLRSDGYLRLTCARLEAQVGSWHPPAPLVNLVSRSDTQKLASGLMLGPMYTGEGATPAAARPRCSRTAGPGRAVLRPSPAPAAG